MTDKFRVIEGGETPKPGRSNRKDETEILICKCNHSTFQIVYQSPIIKNGKMSKMGLKRWKCDNCGTICW